MSKITNMSEYRSRETTANDLYRLRCAYRELGSEYERLAIVSERLTKYMVWSFIINVCAVVYILVSL